MTVKHLFYITMLTLMLGCAHQPVSLAQLQAINPAEDQSTTSNEFVWQWEHETDEALIFVRLEQWLPQQSSGTGRVCLYLPNDEQRLQRLTVGWQRLRAIQQIMAAKGFRFIAELCGHADEPVITLAEGKHHGE